MQLRKAILPHAGTFFRAIAVSIALCATQAQALPDVRVTSDDVSISESCRIVIPAGTVIEDENNNGVIRITASNIEVEFAPGSVLRGSPKDKRPDEYKGYGIRIEGQSNVRIRGARVSGFWAGLWASGTDYLKLEAIDASDNRRAHLKSTPLAEDGADWMFPHNNDDNEWLKNYGAAIYIEDSNSIFVRNCKVSHGQNALCIDRVNRSLIYDNDFSFNSGWGIAMWRCNGNFITRNSCDFCVRGYSHGVYNRGQDSAGILMFEQNNDNIIAENSATHCGDGFFGFAGREALGETAKHPVEWHKRRGNNDNLLINNDFSYAPAHGIEMTFSFGNMFYGNRLVENAICGVWGGYSQNTIITANHFEGNGEMAYGLERGGVNIEHGIANHIRDNTFENNKCGVHLWWDEEGDFAKKPWAQANGTESKRNFIAANTFTGDDVALHFRGPSDVTIWRNKFTDVRQQIQKEPAVTVKNVSNLKASEFQPPNYPVMGQNKPVGARKHLQGRHNIIMTEWGPWDHQSPMIRMVQSTGDSAQYGLHKMASVPEITLEGKGVRGKKTEPREPNQPILYTVSATEPGIHAFLMRVKAKGYEEKLSGTLIAVEWHATFFKWNTDTDPRENLAAWRKLAEGESAVSTRLGQLVLTYGMAGPGEQNLPQSIRDAKLGGNYFGMIAKSRLPLSAGKWEFATLSDDGIRLTVDGKPIIENWTWHGPTNNKGTLELPEDKTVEIVVEHFEIDGYAVLELKISPRP